MTDVSLWLLLAALVCLVRGVTTAFGSNLRPAVRTLWAVWCVALSLYFVSLSQYEAHDAGFNSCWALVYSITSVLLLPLFFHFAGSMASVFGSRRSLVLLWGMYAGAVLFLLGLGIGAALQGSVSDWAPIVSSASMRILYVSFLLVSIGITLLTLFLHDQRASKYRRNRLKFVGLSAGALFVGLLLFELVLMKLLAQPYLSLSLITVPIVSGYLVQHTRTMEFFLVLSRAVMALMLASVFLLYVGTIMLLYPFTGYNGAIVIASALVVGVMLVAPSRRRLVIVLERVIYSGKFRYQEVLTEATQQLATLLDFSQLVVFLKRVLKQNIHTDTVHLLVHDTGQGGYFGVADETVDRARIGALQLREDDPIVQRLKKERCIIVGDEVRATLADEEFLELWAAVSSMNAAVVIPVFYGQSLIAIFLLGHKSDQEIFNPQDVVVLSELAAEAAQAIVNAQLYKDATTDGLTTLYHRRYFDSRIVEEAARAEELGLALSLLMIDLDHFKGINDRHGHLAGDFVLKGVSKRIADCLRDVDLGFRYGGEELAVILPETATPQAETVAERLRREIESHPFVWETNEINVTISIGVGGFTAGMSAEDLIETADGRLYAAKDQGRNRVCVASATKEPASSVTAPHLRN